LPVKVLQIGKRRVLSRKQVLAVLNGENEVEREGADT